MAIRNQVNAAGLAALRTIAQAGSGVVVQGDTLPAGSTEDVLAGLVQRELVEKVGEGFRFQVELIRRWFER